MRKIFLILLYLSAYLTSATVSAQQAGSLPTISHFKQLKPGIYRGGSPELNEVVQLRSFGIKTVINLQGDDFLLPLILPAELPSFRSKLKNVVESYGMIYVNYPIPASRPLTKQEEAWVLRVASVLNRKDLYPIYIHCSRGADRTGLVIAIYRVLYDGWTEQEALEEMFAGGHSGIQYYITPQLRSFLHRVVLWDQSQQ